MKIAITQQGMIGALRSMKSIFEKKSSMAILSNVFVKTNEMDKIDIVASDLEISMKVTVGCDVTEGGSSILNGADLFKSVAACKKGQDVFISSEKDKMTEIKSGTAKFEMYALLDEEFPKVDFGLEDSVVIDKSELKRLISDTVFCASDDKSRPNICGVGIQAEGKDKLSFTATDGHRLARTMVKIPLLQLEKRFKEAIILPKRGALELLKCIDSFSENVKISCDGRVFKVGGDNMNISIRLVEAVFPECEGVIPKTFSREVPISRESAKDIFSRVSSMSSVKNNGVKVMLKKNKLSLETRTPEKGNAFDFVVIDYDGGDFTTFLNARYVLDVLDSIDGAVNVLLKLGDDEFSAVAVTVPEENREENIYIIMPIRI